MDELLVLSSFNETRVLSFVSTDPDAEDEIEEVDIPGFVSDTATLLSCRLGPLFIQVTTRGIGYSDASSGAVGDWAPEGGRKVTLAATDGSYLVLAIEGGVVTVLQLDGASIKQIG